MAFSKSKPEMTERAEVAAIEVHRHLGPGLLESAYEECLCSELSQMGLRFERQVDLPVASKGLKLDCAYKMDLVVENRVVVELKAVDELLPIHSALLNSPRESPRFRASAVNPAPALNLRPL